MALDFTKPPKDRNSDIDRKNLYMPKTFGPGYSDSAPERSGIGSMKGSRGGTDFPGLPNPYEKGSMGFQMYDDALNLTKAPEGTPMRWIQDRTPEGLRKWLGRKDIATANMMVGQNVQAPDLGSWGLNTSADLIGGALGFINPFGAAGKIPLAGKFLNPNSAQNVGASAFDVGMDLTGKVLPGVAKMVPQSVRSSAIGRGLGSGIGQAALQNAGASIMSEGAFATGRGEQFTPEDALKTGASNALFEIATHGALRGAGKVMDHLNSPGWESIGNVSNMPSAPQNAPSEPLRFNYKGNRFKTSQPTMPEINEIPYWMSNAVEKAKRQYDAEVAFTPLMAREQRQQDLEAAFNGPQKINVNMPIPYSRAEASAHSFGPAQTQRNVQEIPYPLSNAIQKAQRQVDAGKTLGPVVEQEAMRAQRQADLETAFPNTPIPGKSFEQENYPEWLKNSLRKGIRQADLEKTFGGNEPPAPRNPEPPAPKPVEVAPPQPKVEAPKVEIPKSEIKKGHSFTQKGGPTTYQKLYKRPLNELSEPELNELKGYLESDIANYPDADEFDPRTYEQKEKLKAVNGRLTGQSPEIKEGIPPEVIDRIARKKGAGFDKDAIVHDGAVLKNYGEAGDVEDLTNLYDTVEAIPPKEFTGEDISVGDNVFIPIRNKTQKGTDGIVKAINGDKVAISFNGTKPVNVPIKDIKWNHSRDEIAQKGLKDHEARQKAERAESEKLNEQPISIEEAKKVWNQFNPDGDSNKYKTWEIVNGKVRAKGEADHEVVEFYRSNGGKTIEWRYVLPERLINQEFPNAPKLERPPGQSSHERELEVEKLIRQIKQAGKNLKMDKKAIDKTIKEITDAWDMMDEESAVEVAQFKLEQMQKPKLPSPKQPESKTPTDLSGLSMDELLKLRKSLEGQDSEEADRMLEKISKQIQAKAKVKPPKLKQAPTPKAETPKTQVKTEGQGGFTPEEIEAAIVRGVGFYDWREFRKTGSLKRIKESYHGTHSGGVGVQVTPKGIDLDVDGKGKTLIPWTKVSKFLGENDPLEYYPVSRLREDSQDPEIAEVLERREKRDEEEYPIGSKHKFDHYVHGNVEVEVTGHKDGNIAFKTPDGAEWKANRKRMDNGIQRAKGDSLSKYQGNFTSAHIEALNSLATEAYYKPGEDRHIVVYAKDSKGNWYEYRSDGTGLVSGEKTIKLDRAPNLEGTTKIEGESSLRSDAATDIWRKMSTAEHEALTKEQAEKLNASKPQGVKAPEIKSQPKVEAPKLPNPAKKKEAEITPKPEEVKKGPTVEDYQRTIDALKADLEDRLQKDIEVMKGSTGKGKENGQIFFDEYGDFAAKQPFISNNPPWYAELQKKPQSEKAWRELALEQIHEGYNGVSGRVGPDKEFIQIENDIAELEKLRDATSPKVSRSIAPVDGTSARKGIVTKKQGDKPLPVGTVLVDKGDRVKVIGSNGEPVWLPIRKGRSSTETKRPIDIKESGTKESTVSLKGIRKVIEDSFAPVRTGRFKSEIPGGRVLGIFKIKDEVIRTKYADDIPVATHELGHYLDSKLNLAHERFDGELQRLGQKTSGADYEPEQIRKEGVAEFTRLYLTRPEDALKEAPNYYKYFEDRIEKNPEGIKKVLDKIATETKTWAEQGHEKRNDAKISVGERGKNESLTWAGFKENPKKTLDEIYTQVIDELLPIKRAVENSGVKLSDAMNPYKQAWIARGWRGMADTFLHKDFLNERGTKIGDSLDTIIQEAKDLQGFRRYAVARHAYELVQWDKEVPQELRDIVKELNDTNRAKYEKTFQKLVKYQENLLNLLADSGRISRADVAYMREKYPNYIPFFRNFDSEAHLTEFIQNRGYANLGNPIKTMTKEGSTQELIDPIESVIKNTYMITAMASKNKVGRALLSLAEQSKGYGRVIEGSSEKELALLGKNSSKDTVLTVYKDGKPVKLQLQEDLYRAALALDQESANVLVKILRPAAAMLRAGATLNPDFPVRNLLRDQFSAAVYSKYGLIPFIDPIKGMFDVFHKTDDYWKWMRAGGAQSTMVAMDRNYLQNSIRKTLQQEEIKSPTDLIKKGLDGLRAFSELLEQGTRVAEFKKGMESGASTIDSAISSRDVTLDFARSGAKTKGYNSVTAFANATLQGNDRIRRAWKDDPQGFVTKAALYITLPSVLLHLYNQDDPRYQELPQYQKDLFWIIPTKERLVKIPKPFELGILFGTMPERVMDYMKTNDPKAFKSLFDTLWKNGIPSVAPTAFVPWVEVATNYDLFKERAIVPQRERLEVPEKQTGAYQSRAANLVGKVFQVSPRKVEHIVSGYTGGLGTTVMRLPEILQGEVAKGIPAKAEDQPILKGFLARPYMNPQSETDFYAKLQDLEDAYSRSGVKGNPPSDLSKARKDAQKLSDLRKKQREVMADPKLSSQMKRTQVDDLNMQMLNLSRQGIGKGSVK